jgi:biopolymer transport protein ExbD
MGAVDTPQKHGKQKGGKKPKKRVAIRIDMTPMVDVAFLLLIFFMVTTVFRQPQALEISLPPKDAKVEVAQSNVMTLRVIKGPKIFWNLGTEPFQPAASIQELGKKVSELGKQNDKLVVLIKISRDTKYQTMVDIVDELKINDLSRFGLAPLEPNEQAEVENL